MSKAILYPEMNAKIADILRFSDDMPHDLYAAAYIEHLQAEVERLTRELAAAYRERIERRDAWREGSEQRAAIRVLTLLGGMIAIGVLSMAIGWWSV